MLLKKPLVQQLRLDLGCSCIRVVLVKVQSTLLKWQIYFETPGYRRVSKMTVFNAIDNAE
jgi:hypothetical protein